MYLKSDSPYITDSAVKILLDPSGQDVEILCNCVCLWDWHLDVGNLMNFFKIVWKTFFSFFIPPEENSSTICTQNHKKKSLSHINQLWSSENVVFSCTAVFQKWIVLTPMELLTAFIRSSVLGKIQPALPACFTVTSLFLGHW